MRPFKHKILFGVLPFVAAAALIGTSIKGAEPQPQNTISKLNANVEVSNDVFHLNYDDETTSIELLFNSRPRAYKSVNKQMFTELSDAFVEIIKEIGKKQIDLGSQYDVQSRKYLPSFDIPIPDEYTGGTRYDISEMISAIMETQLLYDENIREESLLAYTEGLNEAYGIITTYFGFRDAIARDGTTENEETFREIAQEYSAAIVEGLGGKETVNDILDTDDSVGYVAEKIYDLYFDQKVVNNDDYQITAPELGKVIDVAYDAINSSEDDIVTPANVVATLNQGNNDTVKNDISNILQDENTTSKDMLNLLTSGDPVTINEMVIAAGVNGDTVKDGLNKMTGADIATLAGELGGAEGLKDLTQGIEGLTQRDLAELVIGKVTLADIIAMTNELYINGELVMKDHHLSFEGLKKLYRTLPRFRDIKNFSDDEMRRTFALVMETDVGILHFDLTLGLFGDCGYIRRIAKFLDDTFQFDHTGGIYHIKVKNPENLYKAYLKFLNSTAIDDELKHEIIDTVFSTFGEIKQYVIDKDIETLADQLKSIDYAKIAETVLSADEWNTLFSNPRLTDGKIDKAIDEFFKLVDKASTLSYEKIRSFTADFVDISKFTNEQVEKFVDKFFKYVKKVADREFDHELFRALANPDDPSYTNDNVYAEIDRILSHRQGYDKIKRIIVRLLNRVPDKHNDKSIMDYYDGNAHFKYNEYVSIDFNSLLNSAKKYIPDSLYADIADIVAELPTKMHIDADVTTPHIHGITYVLAEHGSGVESPTRTLALPWGANVAFPVNRTEVNGKTIAKWVDANGNVVDTMPDYDIVVYAYVDYTVEITDNTPDVYNGTGSLNVSMNPEVECEYQWYKQVPGGDDIAIDGETSSSLSLVNVDDNGSYYCAATFYGRTEYSEVVTVDINPAPIDVSVASWGQDHFTYSDNGDSYEFKLENIPQGVDVVYNIDGDDLPSGVVPSKTDAHTYVVTPTLSASDSNHVLENDTFTGVGHDFVIDPKIIELDGVSWGQDSFIYSDDGDSYEFKLEGIPAGVAVTYTIDGVDLPSGTIPSKTEFGTYEVIPHLSVTDTNHVLGDDPFSGVAHEFSIGKKIVDLSNVAWTYPDHDVEYTAHDIVFDLTGLPKGVSASYEVNGYSVPSPVGLELGDYHVKATLSVDSNHAFADGATIVYEKDYEIIANTIDLANVVWGQDHFEYNGQAHEFKLDLSSLDEAEIEGLNIVYTYKGVSSTTVPSEVEIGNYSASVTVSSKDPLHYVVINDSISGTSHDFEIVKGVIKEDMFSWKDHDDFVWDGTTVYNIELENSASSPIDAMSLVNIVYSEGSKEVGSHQTTATITVIDTTHYELRDANNQIVSELSIVGDYEVNKQTINPSFTFDDATFTFEEGVSHVIELVGEDEDFAHVIVTYTCGGEAFTGKVDAGTYVVTATITLADEAHYQFGQQTQTEYSATLQIDPARIDVSMISWDSVAKEVNFSEGVDHIDEFKLDESIFPTNVTVAYVVKDANGNEVTSAINAGSYTVVATLSSTNSNYIVDSTKDSVSNVPVTFTVKPIEIPVSTIAFGPTELTYDGSEQYFELQGIPTAYQDKIDVSYTVNGDAVVSPDRPSGTNAGDYAVVATLTVNDSNYVFVGGASSKEYSTTFNIDKQSINVGSVAFQSNTPFDYDGNEHNFGLVNLPMDGVNVVYTLNGQELAENVVPTGKNAGSYEISAVLSPVDADNYRLINDNISNHAAVTYTIKKVAIDDSQTQFINDANLTYNGQDYAFGLENLPSGTGYSGVAYTVNGAASTDPKGKDHLDGGYAVVATLTAVNDNYYFLSSGESTATYTRTFNIAKAEVTPDFTMTDVTVDYDGNAHSIYLVGDDSLVNIVYENNGKTNAGMYVVSADLALKDTNNYVFSSTAKTHYEATLTIKKVAINVGSVSFKDNTPFDYDTLEHSFGLNGLPMDGVNVVYTLNGQELAKNVVPTGKNAGDYVISAVLSPVDAVNYYLANDSVSSHAAVTYTINKAAIDVGSVAFKDNTPFDYDKQDHNFGLNGLPMDGVDVVYTLNDVALDKNVAPVVKNAGSYEISAVLSPVDAVNYYLTNDNVSGKPAVTYTINKVAIDDSNVHFINEATLQFEEGTTYSFALTDLPTAEGFKEVKYTVNGVASTDPKGANVQASGYVVVATLHTVDDNYYFTSSNSNIATYTRTFVINPIQISLDNVKYGETELTYIPGGEKQYFDLEGVPTEYDGKFTVSYVVNNKPVAVNEHPYGVNAGNYTVTATLKITDSNYVFVEGGSTKTTKVYGTTFHIAKYVVDLDNVAFQDSFTISYDAQEHDLSLIDEDNVLQYANVVYTINGKESATVKVTHSGEYVVSVVVSPIDAVNYELINDHVSDHAAVKYVIERVAIDITNVKFINDEDLQFAEGTTFSLGLENLPEGETGYKGVKYVINEESVKSVLITDAGTYKVVATLHTVDDNYYFIVDGVEVAGIYERTFVIKPIVIDVSDVKFDGEIVDGKITFTFDNQEHSFELVGLPDDSHYNVKYNGSKQIPVGFDSGEYEIVAVLKTINENYIFSDTLDHETVRSVTFVINKIQIDVSLIEWDYANVINYDFNSHDVALVDVPEGLVITYGGDYHGMKDIGTYKATASAELVEEYKRNYEIVGTIKDLTWEIFGKTHTSSFHDKDNILTVETVDGSLIQNAQELTLVITPNDTEVDVTTLDLNEYFHNKDTALVGSYEIKFVDESGNTVDMQGLYNVSFHVNFKMTAEDLKSEIIEIFTYSDMDHVDSKLENGILSFDEDNFSKYTVVKSVVPPPQADGTNLNIAAFVFMVGGSTFFISAFNFVILFFKKKRF